MENVAAEANNITKAAIHNSNKATAFWHGILKKIIEFFGWIWERFEKLLGGLRPLIVPIFRGIKNGLQMLGTALVNFLKILIALLNARAIEIILYILLIVFLIWGISRSIRASRSSGGSRGRSGSTWGNWWANAQRGVQKTFTGYRQFNPYAVNKVDREQDRAGRCDDKTYIETTGNKCVYDGQPAPTRWTIRSADLAGWTMLPQRLQERLNLKGAHETVYIPWVFNEQTGRFMPNCAAAQFKDGQSAAYLIKDAGSICRRSMPNRKQFKVAANKRIVSRPGTHGTVYSKLLDPEKC